MTRFQYRLYLIIIIIGLNSSVFFLVRASVANFKPRFEQKYRVLNEDAEQNWLSPLDQLSARIDSSYLARLEYRDKLIPKYREYFQKTASDYGYDWRLLAAIAYVESRYDAQAKSKSGAIGLMQIMARTAQTFDVQAEELFDPEVNIDICARYMDKIDKMLKFPDHIEPKDRIALTLACYHGGIGRMFDAQRLALSQGASKYDWQLIEQIFPSLQYKEVYTRPEVYYGQYRGGPYTIKYVNRVFDRYYFLCEYFALN